MLLEKWHQWSGWTRGCHQALTGEKRSVCDRRRSEASRRLTPDVREHTRDDLETQALPRTWPPALAPVKNALAASHARGFTHDACVCAVSHDRV